MCNPIAPLKLEELLNAIGFKTICGCCHRPLHICIDEGDKSILVCRDETFCADTCKAKPFCVIIKFDEDKIQHVLDRLLIPGKT